MKTQLRHPKTGLGYYPGPFARVWCALPIVKLLPFAIPRTWARAVAMQDVLKPRSRQLQR
jgi:hypothetical protein